MNEIPARSIPGILLEKIVIDDLVPFESRGLINNRVFSLVRRQHRLGCLGFFDNRTARVP